MPARFESRAPNGVIVLRTPEAFQAFVTVHSELYPQSLRPGSLFEMRTSRRTQPSIPLPGSRAT